MGFLDVLLGRVAEAAGELVATAAVEPRIPAGSGAQLVAERAQHLVGRLMAHAVVQPLQAVHVQRDDGSPAQRRIGIEGFLVRQAGQRVGTQLALKLLG